MNDLIYSDTITITNAQVLRIATQTVSEPTVRDHDRELEQTLTILHYKPSPRVAGFLPGHLREAANASIRILDARWDGEGGAYVNIDINSIDPDSTIQKGIVAKAGRHDGSDGGYVRTTVDVIPEGLKAIDY